MQHLSKEMEKNSIHLEIHLINVIYSIDQIYELFEFLNYLNLIHPCTHIVTLLTKHKVIMSLRV